MIALPGRAGGIFTQGNFVLGRVLARARRSAARAAELPGVLLVDAPGGSPIRLRDRFENGGFRVTTPQDGEAAWELFQQQPFDLVVVDLQLPEIDAIAFIRRLRSARSRDARAPIFLIVPPDSLSSVVAAGRAGVTDCFHSNEDDIRALLSRARALLASQQPELPFVLLGKNSAILAARDRVQSLAALSTPVLISGERGTGHAHVVEYLHACANQAPSALHCIDCRTLPEAPTPVGPGTCYLEEVQDLAPTAQVVWYKWLLDARLSNESSSIRVVASTTKDPRVLAAKKQFSSDLARELCQFEVWLPPLRDRVSDLPELTQILLESASRRIGRSGVKISPQALERLCACAWWENFSDLENVIGSLAAFAPDAEITETDVELVLIDSDPMVRAARERDRCEREQLLTVFEECGGNRTHMAERLKVDRGTIRYRLRKHGILPQRDPRSGD